MALTKCKECSHEISDQATSCPSCGAPQKLKPKGIGAGGWILILVVGWIAYTIFSIDGGRSTNSTSTAGSSATSAPAAGPLLEVRSWRCDKEYSYVFVRGEVKNISSQPLKNVTAVGEFRTKSGELVKSESALLDYNPILPGQTSPFKAGGTDNPQINGCNVSFKYLLGGTVNFTHRKKGK